MNEDNVRNAAYARWEAEGRPEGAHDRHWQEAEHQIRSSEGTPHTWSADHGGGVSPSTSTASLNEEQVDEPANEWPSAGEAIEHVSEAAPSPVEEFELPNGDGRRTFQNGDTDRS